MKMRKETSSRAKSMACGLRAAGVAVVAAVMSGCGGPGVGGPGAAGVRPEPAAPAEQRLAPEAGASAGRQGGASTWNQPVPKDRPGLATGWGRELRVEGGALSRPFARASAKPAGTDVIYYNDREGVEAMAGYKSKTDGWRQAAGGMVEWGIKTGWGMAPTWQASWFAREGSRRFVVGQLNQEYSIVVRNRCKCRVEVVLSVDGLSVLDGRPASTRSGGHVIEPGQTLEVKGFRTGPDTVAAFRFSTVGGSYANLKHGETRNVGVIGMAVFTERGFDPWTWMPREVEKRETARPFAEAP